MGLRMGAWRGMRRWLAGVLAVIGALAWGACAASPPAPRAGLAVVAGTLELVPRDGLPTHHAPGAYGDRRLRDVTWVDYSKPDSAVVYLDAGTRPGGRVSLAAEDTVTGSRLAPRFEVVGAGGAIAIDNRSTRAAVVSIPGLDSVERLEPGAGIAVRAERPGPVEIFLLGADEPSVVWVAPGPWTRPGPDGRYALVDLPPGPATLRAWHPRLPGAVAEVELHADEITPLDFELGVGRGEGPDAP